MITQFFFGVQRSLQGQTLGTLYVERVVGAHPLRYQARCTVAQCGTVAVYSHLELRNPRCKSPTCNLHREREEQLRKQRRPVTEADHNSFDPAHLTVKGRVPW